MNVLKLLFSPLLASIIKPVYYRGGPTKRRLLLFLSPALIMILPGSSYGAPTGLLTGKTPSNYSVPAGWSIWQDEDFDTTPPVCAHPSEYCGGAVSTTQAHHGTHSLRGNNGARWSTHLPVGRREVYLSFYEWKDSIGRQNDEMFQAHFKTVLPSGYFQEAILDWFHDSTGTFNSLAGRLLWEPQGTGPTRYYHNRWLSSNVSPGFGAGWQQWEIHYKANSTSCAGGCADGILQIWRNGVNIANIQNAVLNGGNNMGSGKGMLVQIAGHYTKIPWLKNCTTTASCKALVAAGGPYVCGKYIGDGYGPDLGLTLAQTAAICPSLAPTFNRYIDDIIVLYR